MKCEPFEFSGFVKNFRSPAVLSRRSFDVAQHGANINRLAVIAAMIFAELLHAENIMQLVALKCNEGGRRNNAKNFYPSSHQRPPQFADELGA